MKNKTRISLVMFGFVIIFAGGVWLDGANPEFATSSSFGILSPILNVVGIFGPAISIAALFALHHPRSGRYTWLMPSLWAAIFTVLWFAIAWVIASFVTNMFGLNATRQWLLSDATNVVYSLLSEWKILLGMTALSVGITQPIVYWAHRPKKQTSTQL